MEFVGRVARYDREAFGKVLNHPIRLDEIKNFHVEVHFGVVAPHQRQVSLTCT